MSKLVAALLLRAGIEKQDLAEGLGMTPGGLTKAMGRPSGLMRYSREIAEFMRTHGMAVSVDDLVNGREEILRTLNATIHGLPSTPALVNQPAGEMSDFDLRRRITALERVVQQQAKQIVDLMLTAAERDSLLDEAEQKMAEITARIEAGRGDETAVRRPSGPGKP